MIEFGLNIWVIGALVVVMLLVMSLRIVPQGYGYTVEQFGRYVGTIMPGLHVLIPFVQTIGAKVSLMETVLEVPTQDVITRDNAAVMVDGVVFFQIFDASKSAYAVANLRSATLNLTMTNIRTVMGSMDLDELLSNREAINIRLLTVIDQVTESWGTKVTRVEIKDIKPPKDLVESMGRQMKAERDKRALILEAEGERQAQILKSEGEKQAVILESEGRLLAANQDAQARERMAQAEANATKMLADITSSEQALKYFVAQRYVDAFKALADEQ